MWAGFRIRFILMRIRIQIRPEILMRIRIQIQGINKDSQSQILKKNQEWEKFWHVSTRPKINQNVKEMDNFSIYIFLYHSQDITNQNASEIGNFEPGSGTAFIFLTDPDSEKKCVKWPGSGTGSEPEI